MTLSMDFVPSCHVMRRMQMPVQGSSMGSPDRVKYSTRRIALREFPSAVWMSLVVANVGKYSSTALMASLFWPLIISSTRLFR